MNNLIDGVNELLHTIKASQWSTCFNLHLTRFQFSILPNSATSTGCTALGSCGILMGTAHPKH